MADVTMGELCAYLRNYFTQPCDRHPGTYTVSGGVLSPCGFLPEGTYYRIIGSRFNDGVYRLTSGAAPLCDECFTGCVWVMRVPSAVEALLSEISAWQEKYGQAQDSPYSFESFGGYSYSKPARKTDPVSRDSSGWRGIFAGRLAPWRKQTV